MKKFTLPTLKYPRVALALMGALVIAPAAATLHASVVQKAVSGGDMKQDVLQDAPRVRQIRRDFWRAVDVYKRLLQEGATNLAPPELNDTASIEFYLNFEGGGSLKGAAPEDIPTISDAQSRYNALPEWERDRLDGYVSTGICPETMKAYLPVPDFYELCNELLAERTSNERPQINLDVLSRQSHRTLNGSPIQTLRLRLRQLDQSLSAPRTYNGTSRPRIHLTR